MQQLVSVIQDTVLYLVSFVRGSFRSLRDNKGLAAVSVVLAFGIWIVVIEADNPTRTTIVPYDLVIEPINVPPTVAVVEPILGPDVHVRVRVAVADDEFESLRAADFQATVDLENATVGDYPVEIKVRPLTNRGGLRVEQVIPAQITVTLATLASKEVPVTAEVQGTLISGYTMTTPELEDASVIVSGPQGEVDKVTQVTATIDVEGLNDSLDQAVRLVARDGQGTLVPGVELNPDLTNAHIEVEQQKFSRSMAVSATITGVAADGYNVVSVSVSPPTVTIRGEEAFISGTASVPTKPLNIDGADDNVVKTVSLDLPTGAEVTGGVPVVTVTVKVAPATGVYNFSIPVTAKDLGDDVAVNGALPSVIVTISGPLPQLQALSPNDISASVDLGGKNGGTHRVNVDVIAPTGLTVAQVSPTEFDVTLVQR
jgi:YbbR domain-containing protein